jgi:hypothetical protein
VILERGKYSKYLPFAFTEQGVAMLSILLNSERAIDFTLDRQAFSLSNGVIIEKVAHL